MFVQQFIFSINDKYWEEKGAANNDHPYGQVYDIGLISDGRSRYITKKFDMVYIGYMVIFL